MILLITILFLMNLQCNAIGNTSFSGKLSLVASEGSNVNLPCTYTRNQSDMVTLILFYRNASHVGQLGAPLYTLDARMINDKKLVDDKQILNDEKSSKILMHFKELNSKINYNNDLVTKTKFTKKNLKRSLNLINRHEKKITNKNHKLPSISNVSMINGLSSLMHLLAIKGHLNQTKNQLTFKEFSNKFENSYQEKLVRELISDKQIEKNDSQDIDDKIRQENYLTLLNEDSNLKDQNIYPQHFVSSQFLNRIRLIWPPSQLKLHQPYSNPESKNLSQLKNQNHKKNDTLVHFNAILTIQNVTEEDAGEYLCRVDFRWGRTIVNYIQLEIVSTPKTVIILDSNSQVLHDWTAAYLENSYASFNCEVDGGRPQTPIEWLLNGELLNSKLSKPIKLQNFVTRSQLQLQMTRELFNGTLTCRVQNSFYGISTTVHLDIILKPQRITIRPTLTPLLIDNQNDLIVQTHGSYPPSDLVCFLNNQTLNGELKKVTNFKMFSITTLIIKYIPSREDHNEQIFCKAINHAFPMNESVLIRYNLDIHYKPILKLASYNNNSNQFNEGSALTIRCLIDSNPPFKEIQWFKNGLLFSSLNNQDQTFFKIYNTSLITNNLVNTDSGRYSCSAKNSVGTSDSEFLTIDVLHSPECKSNQKFIYGIEYGESIVINCELTANPSDHLTFHWRWHSLDGSIINLATISTEIVIDDTFNRLSPKFSALVNSSNSLDKNYNLSSHASSNSKTSNLYLKDNQHLLKQFFISSNGTTSSLHYTMTRPSKELGAISCWASNSIGIQKEPCVYSLIVLDVPEQIENCTINAPMPNFHLLECSPGKNNGLPQKFHCEVYVYLEKKTDATEMNKLIFEENKDDINYLKSYVQNDDNNLKKFFKVNNIEENEVKLNKPIEQHLVLIANYTELSYPTFVLSLVNMNLSKILITDWSNIDTLYFNIYASNSKGCSKKISLDLYIGNQTNQLKQLFLKNNPKPNFNLLNEWVLIFTATLSTLMVWFLFTIIYLVISSRIKQIKLARRYIRNYNENSLKRNQIFSTSNQGMYSFDSENCETEIQSNILGENLKTPSFYDSIRNFEKSSNSSQCLSTYDLLKLKSKQLE